MDPELRAGLQSHLPQMLSKEDLAQYRSMLLDMVAAIPKPASEAMARVKFQKLQVPGIESGADVTVLVYIPDGKVEALLPAILHVHGGGFVSGTAVMSDRNSRSYAVEMNCAVVLVDYRLAPETAFPGPLYDCQDAGTADGPAGRRPGA